MAANSRGTAPEIRKKGGRPHHYSHFTIIVFYLRASQGQAATASDKKFHPTFAKTPQPPKNLLKSYHTSKIKKRS
jgi:hypothetical protein